MKLWKVALVVILLISTTLLFFGCGESFTYAFYTDNVGGVHTDITFVYEKDAYDAKEVKEQAIQAMRNYVTARSLNAYATLTSDVDGVVKLELSFPSVTDYYIALGYTGKERNEPYEPTKVGFIDTYEDRQSSYLTEANIRSVRAAVSEEFADFPLDCDFYYTYGTTSKLTQSNGEVEERDGIYYHTWKLNYGEDADIVITKYAPNGVILMSIVISIFVLSLAIIFVIIFITRKKKARRAAAAATDGDAEGGDAPEQ